MFLIVILTLVRIFKQRSQTLRVKPSQRKIPIMLFFCGHPPKTWIPLITSRTVTKITFCGATRRHALVILQCRTVILRHDAKQNIIKSFFSQVMKLTTLFTYFLKMTGNVDYVLQENTILAFLLQN